MTQTTAMFEKLGGEIFKDAGGAIFPAIHARPMETSKGTPYLTEPGVVLINQPRICLAGLRGFLAGFDGSLDFMQYLDDEESTERAGQLVKLCGQLCYMSFGPKRSKNDELGKYLEHIKQSGHGSVMEHPSYTVVLYGIDRSVTHELVRHRVGVAYSQVSQRFVDGKVLRFVKRPEFDGDAELSGRFADWIDASVVEYDARAAALTKKFATDPGFVEKSKTDQRKAVNQAARSCLPNEAEAPIAVSLNVRALRHLSEMRVSKPADVLIRRAFFKVFLCLSMLEPSLFSDYVVEEQKDGTYAVETKYRKV
jgi:thymidylate synthase (FAD)